MFIVFTRALVGASRDRWLAFAVDVRRAVLCSKCMLEIIMALNTAYHVFGRWLLFLKSDQD